MAADVLCGKRVVVTQAVHQAPELCSLLRSRGAESLLYPCIAIEPPMDTAALDAALRQAVAGEFDWLVATSANTVMLLSQRLAALGVSPRSLGRLRIAAVGPPTAEAVYTHWGLRVALVPEDHVAEGLAAALLAVLSPGQRVLLPQADAARPVMAQQLAAAGVDVTSVVAYRTTIGRGGVDLAGLIARGEVDAILLTSSSTARNLLARLQADGGELSLPEGVRIVCLGPITADTARELGLPVTAVATTQSLEGLVEALAHTWKEKESA